MVLWNIILAFQTSIYSYRKISCMSSTLVRLLYIIIVPDLPYLTQMASFANACGPRKNGHRIRVHILTFTKVPSQRRVTASDLDIRQLHIEPRKTALIAVGVPCRPNILVEHPRTITQESMLDPHQYPLRARVGLATHWCIALITLRPLLHPVFLLRTSFQIILTSRANGTITRISQRTHYNSLTRYCHTIIGGNCQRRFTMIS